METLQNKNIRDISWYQDSILVAAKDGIWSYDFDKLTSPKFIMNGNFFNKYPNENDIFLIETGYPNNDLIVFWSRNFKVGLFEISDKNIIDLATSVDVSEIRFSYDGYRLIYFKNCLGKDKKSEVERIRGKAKHRPTISKCSRFAMFTADSGRWL